MAEIDDPQDSILTTSTCPRCGRRPNPDVRRRPKRASPCLRRRGAARQIVFIRLSEIATPPDGRRATPGRVGDRQEGLGAGGRSPWEADTLPAALLPLGRTPFCRTVVATPRSTVIAAAPYSPGGRGRLVRSTACSGRTSRTSPCVAATAPTMRLGEPCVTSFARRRDVRRWSRKFLLEAPPSRAAR